MRFGNVKFKDEDYVCRWRWLNLWKYRRWIYVRYEDQFEINNIVIASTN